MDLLTASIKNLAQVHFITSIIGKWIFEVSVKVKFLNRYIFFTLNIFFESL